MPKASGVQRAFVEVQRIITAFIQQGINPTMQQIQSVYYGSEFNADSLVQRQIIYSCIMKGRENVIILWEAYAKSDQFTKDLELIENYRTEDIEKQIDSKEFRDFHWQLHSGRFGKETREIVETLEHYPAIANIFQDKMFEYSKTGNNFIIASYGKESQWYIPTFWTWNIREFKLYTRTLKILRRQLARGVKTKVLLPSGQPIEKVLLVETVVRASLEDKTVWVCPNCTARNLESSNICSICGTDKP